MSAAEVAAIEAGKPKVRVRAKAKKTKAGTNEVLNRQVGVARRIVANVLRRLGGNVTGEMNDVYDQLLHEMTSREKNKLGSGPMTTRQAFWAGVDSLTAGGCVISSSTGMRLKVSLRKKRRRVVGVAPRYTNTTRGPLLQRV